VVLRQITVTGVPHERALTCHQQALLALRWLLDGTRMSQLARDNKIILSTGYERLHEAIDVLAAQAPGLHSALLAAKTAGYDYVLPDGTLIETDRVSTPGPTPEWTCGGRPSTSTTVGTSRS
jgi:hypothetical protein